MKMYVKPSFELEEVLSEDIITESAFRGVVGGFKPGTDASGNPDVEVDIEDLIGGGI